MNNDKIISFMIYRLGYPIEILDVSKITDIDRVYDEIMKDDEVMKIDFVYGDNHENN